MARVATSPPYEWERVAVAGLDDAFDMFLACPTCAALVRGFDGGTKHRTWHEDGAGQ